MIPNTAFSPSVSLVHKWANAVAAEMRALHWGAERVFLMLSLAVVPFMPPSWPARTSLNEKREEGMMLCLGIHRNLRTGMYLTLMT